MREFEYRVCPTIGTIDILNPYLATLWPGREMVGHNINRCISDQKLNGGKGLGMRLATPRLILP